MRAYVIPAGTADISDAVLDERGRLRILPAAFWAETTIHERALLCVKHALYCIPTVELIERLQELIGGRSAIEIAAGNGLVAEALGIVGTDSHQQLLPKYRRVYENMGQPVIAYGPNVQNMDAATAIRTHRPDVVIGCWVTHKWEASRHWAGGNEAGVDEMDVLANCQNYIFVGNTQVHRAKNIWDVEHQIEYPPFLYSRAMNETKDFICVWKGRQ